MFSLKIEENRWKLRDLLINVYGSSLIKDLKCKQKLVFYAQRLNRVTNRITTWKGECTWPLILFNFYSSLKSVSLFKQPYLCRKIEQTYFKFLHSVDCDTSSKIFFATTNFGILNGRYSRPSIFALVIARVHYIISSGRCLKYTTITY